MKKLFIIISILSLISCSNEKEKSLKNENKQEVEILVLAAASLTDVMKELSQAYKNASNKTKVNFSFASSGALQNQIEAGAPADIFFSASQKQMNALEEKKLIDTNTRRTLLENKVVLITPKNSSLNIKSFYDITNESVKRVGLGEPKSVPVGQYSEEIFNNMNILDKVTTKAVYGSDVRAVLTWVENGEVDLGLVYETDAKIATNINIIGEAPKGSHKPATYPVAVIKSSKNKDEANSFIEFLSSDQAMSIFSKYGFSSSIN